MIEVTENDNVTSNDRILKDPIESIRLKNGLYALVL